MLIGFIGVIIAVIAGVRQGLEPVNRMRQQVLDRSPQQLDPILIDAPPEELRPMIDSINDLLLRLKAALETERRFIADASHELRTPLTAVKAQIQVINRGRLDKEVLASIDKIHSGIDRATRLIDQLLTLARSEAGSVKRKTERVDLSEIARDEITRLFPQAVSANVEMEFAGTPSSARGNATEISILIRNLVDNAIRYAGAGTIVKIEAGSSGGRSFISVDDTGPGMSNEDFEHAFARFRRGSNAAGPGSGLGLSIARSIAERHGGTVELKRSQPYGGLSAVFSLPSE